MNIQGRIDTIAFLNPNALTADGFDEAIIGWVRLEPHSLPITLYSYEICVEILMEEENMCEEDAIEWMDFNVVGSYMGPGTPAFISDIFEDGEEPYVFRVDGEYYPYKMFLFDDEEEDEWIVD